MITNHNAPAYGILETRPDGKSRLFKTIFGAFATNDLSLANQIALEETEKEKTRETPDWLLKHFPRLTFSVVPVKEIPTKRKGCGPRVMDIVPA